VRKKRQETFGWGRYDHKTSRGGWGVGEGEGKGTGECICITLRTKERNEKRGKRVAK